MNQPNAAQPNRELRLFPVVAMLFVALLLISNIAAQKLFAFGGLVFTAGIIVFPVTYIFGDCLTEVYGYARARAVIWTGFVANLVMALILWVAIQLPPAPGWPLQQQFEEVLGLVPRIVAASIVGYWLGEFTNSYVIARMKVATRGRWFPLRAIASTVAGQFVDTCVFVVLAFSFVFEINLLLAAILNGWLFKVAYEVLAVPLTTWLVQWLKRYEKVDHYDVGTNFNPFAVTKI